MLAGTAALTTACTGDATTATTPQPPRGIVVLDGFIQPGLTLLADTGITSTRLAFGPTTEFDGSGIVLSRDTVLAVSSRAAGDLLFLADLRASVVRKLQLPARSNPARARLLQGAGGQALIAAALRDSQSIALLSVTGATVASSTRITNAGACPTDLFIYDNATWIVDANSACRTTYAVQGDVRLIRVPASGAVRDTITLTGVRGSAAAATVTGDVAYISAGGDADFSRFPYTLRTTGSVAKVDLRGKRVQVTRAMPAGSYGASVRLGLDGFLYASLYENLSTFTNRIVKLRADDLTFVTTPGAPTPAPDAPWLTLVGGTGSPVTCGSAQADALGRVHCLVNGTGSVTSLVVFSPSGTEIRRVPAGQGGTDLALR
jgi:hypothetical protein